jgi:hypothetical protein
VVASPSARLASACLTTLCCIALGCVEGGTLAISAGAPVMAAVQGRVTDCGFPVAGAEVVLRIRQDLAEQARPVDARIGPLTTGRDGSYFAELGPPFAVPGLAGVQLTLTAAGVTVEREEASLRFTLGTPARDTLRLDTDLAVHRGFCLD